MMTIASVTFSITIVALQLASSQFGPRLLRNFMRDRGNQVAIGTFIATFTYCLLVLRTVNGTEQDEFVPHISVSVGLVLALISLGVLIFFIHHSAESIQAENVIASVSDDLHMAIDRLYPERLGKGPDERADKRPKPKLPDGFEQQSRAIPACRSDYLQAIDVERLLREAKERDLVVSIDHRPGKFIFKGNSLARVWPPDRLDDELEEAIRGLFYFGRRRTLVQDVEFAVDQLVEVAVRALSPGLNDPFTAMTCVDRLGAALCSLSERVIPSPCRYDEDGKLRIVTDRSTVAGIMDASFDQIRQAVRSIPAVAIRMFEAIIAVASYADAPEFRESLRRHAQALHRATREGFADPADREDADRRFRQVMEILDSPARSDSS